MLSPFSRMVTSRIQGFICRGRKGARQVLQDLYLEKLAGRDFGSSLRNVCSGRLREEALVHSLTCCCSSDCFFQIYASHLITERLISFPGACSLLGEVLRTEPRPIPCRVSLLSMTPLLSTLPVSESQCRGSEGISRL
jgi:hypothetical protein